MAAFSLQLDLAIEVNRHFLENEYGDWRVYGNEIVHHSSDNETVGRNCQTFDWQ